MSSAHMPMLSRTSTRCSTSRASAGFLLVFSSLLGQSTSARASCWPPLNSQETRQSNPANVMGYTFRTGSYSWWVERYVVNQLRCSQSINEGPRHWSATLGLDDDNTFGVSPGASTGNASRRDQSVLGATRPLPLLPALPANQSPLPRLPSLNTLPALPATSTSLPTLPILPPLTRTR